MLRLSCFLLKCGVATSILLAVSWTSQAQQSFDIQAYQSFVTSHANLSASGLLDLYPAGRFKSNVNIDPDSAAYFDSIRAHYNLTDEELGLIRKNGFVVSERSSRRSFGAALLEIYNHDLPVFVSTDAILHAVHMSYDAILKDAETGILIPGLRQLLADMHQTVPSLITRYDTAAGMQNSLDDLDLYLTTARVLLGDSVPPYRDSNSTRLNEILALIRAQQDSSYALFSDTFEALDFSQFTPRGHYTESQELTRYFQSMIWLGRTELQVLPAEGVINALPLRDVKRQTVDAFLVLEALEAANDLPLQDSLDSIIRFFVGESDNITIPNLKFLRDEVGFHLADELLNDSTLAVLRSTLKQESFAIQRINSQILICDPMDPDQAKPPASFLLFGQRFVIDSYVTGSVVYDKIIYNGDKIWRQLPSSLDVLFALGNGAAAQLLQDELNQYHYGSNLAALRYLVDSYDSTFWYSTLYNAWLNSIRTLSPPQDRSGFPAFMQTAAWWQEKMNTQLASWAQLRHDNLLYAKQSYTGGTVCSYPKSFVEPFPKFFEALKQFAIRAEEKLLALDFSQGYIRPHLQSYFSGMKSCMDTLQSISQKEVDQIACTPAETQFLRKMFYTLPYCGPGYDGWYPQLFYNNIRDCDSANFVVADVHTAPTDEFGNIVGKVMHCGTGPINLAILVAELSGGVPTAFIGPVMSYYEHVTLNFKRLTDEEWKLMYNVAPSFRPPWVNLYLADSAGAQRPEGPMLLTGVDVRRPGPPLPASLMLRQNFPNPFNPSTVIGFTVPHSALQTVDLVIYDVLGRPVRRLVHEVLSAGNYLAKWDGKTELGMEAAAGVYIDRLTIGNLTESKEMMLIK
ncbi:MAG: DUF3160 domain-containing protein [Bacteroidota bacterium]|jgi:hypothetical protein